MGERINYIFDDGSDALTVLYSHWGANGWQNDLANALVHAKPRKDDYPYFTRMIISKIIGNRFLDETGFGIYAINRDELGSPEHFDAMVIIDLVNKVIIPEDSNPIPFYSESLVH